MQSITNYELSYEPGTIERHYTFVFRDTKTLSFSLGHIRVSCKCTSKTLNNYEGFLINYANTAIDIYE